MSVTLDMAPVIGYLGEDKKAVFAMGCIGHGVSMTTLNGRTIAELVLGKQTERSEMFFVGRKIFPWPPGPISYGLVQAIRGFMKLEDCLYYKRGTARHAVPRRRLSRRRPDATGRNGMRLPCASPCLALTHDRSLG